VSDSLSGCCFNAVENQWALNLDPILDSPHGLGFQVIGGCVEKDVTVAVTGILSQAVQGGEFSVNLFLLHLRAGR
jgi:hypothetical protein